jgi:hypothetical protein
MKATTRQRPKTLPRLSVIVAIASFASLVSEAGTKQGYRFETRPFQHELFDYGRVQADQRDPSLPLTAEEEALLKGEGFDGLTIRDGAPYIEYSLKRIGLVRAIGFQKQDKWIPLLIDRVVELNQHKASMQRLEVRHPCVWALAKLGEPSVEPILKAIGESDNLAQRQLLFRALEGIRGEDGAIQLIEERDIKIKRPDDSPSRPSKRGSHSAAHPDAGSASASQNSKAIQSSAPTNSRRWIIWVVLLLLFALAIASMRRLTSRPG